MKAFFLAPMLMVLLSSLVACSTPYNLPISIPTNKTASMMEFSDTHKTVSMGAPYMKIEKPTVDWAQARIDAAKFCANRWDLENAEPYGTTRKTCVTMVGSVCERYALVGDYRCLP